MKKTILIFLALLLNKNSSSQISYSWMKSLNYPFLSPNDQLIRGIKVSNSGNVYIIGDFKNTLDFDLSNSNFFLTPNITNSCFLAKYTSSGNFIWAKEIIAETVVAPGGGKQDVNDFVIDSNENIYITGSYMGTVDFDPNASSYTLCATNSNNARENQFVYTAKYNSNGNLVWVKDLKRAVLSSGQLGEFGFGISIALDGNDNIYVGARCNNLPYFCKYNSSGTKLWQDSLVSSTNSNNANELTGFFVNSSGEVFVGGILRNDIDMDPGVGVSILTAQGAIFFGKYSTNGTFMWGKKLNAFGNINSITTDVGGNIYTCGFGVNANYQNLITKWDNSGNLQWNNYFGTSNPYSHHGCSDISISCNNEIITTGFMSGNANFDPLGGTYTCAPDPILSPFAQNFVFIASYSPTNGSILWAKCIGGSLNPPNNLNSNAFVNLSNSFVDNVGCIYLYGSVNGVTQNDFDPNIGTVTLTPSSSNVFFAKYTGCGVSSNIDYYNGEISSKSISPNPSKGEYAVEGLSEKLTIEIYDVMGRIVYSKYIDQNDKRIDLTGKNTGIYIYKILNKEKVIKQGKLILE